MTSPAALRRSTPRLQVALTLPDGAVPAARGLARWLESAGPARARGELTVAIVSDRRMRSLNRAFRGDDHTTDVLSFPAVAGPGTPARGSQPRFLGDIVVAAGVARRQAGAAGHALRTELRVLALHGLLHLLGHDHDAPEDGRRMARMEARLRRAGRLPEGLIERARKS